MSERPKRPEILGYYSPETRQKLQINKEGMTTFDLGKTIPGIEKRFTLIVKNEFTYPVELTDPHTEDKDLHITSHPKYLMPGQTGNVDFTFSPNTERLVPLNASWGFTCVIG